MSDSDKPTGSTAIAATQRAEDGKKAMAEYEAAAIAIRVKTEKLRAARLAREAEAAKSAPKKVAKKKAGAKTAGGKGKASGTLSDWLDAQERGGRRA